MINSILVPVDFSAPSRQAYKYAVAMAEKLETSITLLHVIPPSTIETPYALIGKNVRTTETEKAETRLNRWSVSEFIKKVPVITIVRESTSVTDEIVYEARKGKYRLIVMGAKGATNLKEKWMGTVTQKVISDARCPVLAVPARSEFTGIRKVIFATDYWKRELAALKGLEQLLLPFKPSILVTHISTSKISHTLDESLQKQFITDIKKRVKNLKTTFTEVEHEDILKGLHLAARQYSADLIVMVTEEVTFLERILVPSITRKMALRTRLPLLAIKDSYKQ